MARIQKQCPVCSLPADEKSHTLLPSPINLVVINLVCGHSYTEKLETQKDWQKIETYPEFTQGKRLKLFPYQGEGYEFCRQANFRALIGDEPGLGKTYQATACIRLHPELLTPALIVCKSALKIQQLRAGLQILGPEYLPFIINKSSDRPSSLFKVTIVTYDILWRIVKKQNEAREAKELEIRIKLGLSDWDVIPEEYQAELPVVENPFATYGFQYVILDECQQIKNQGSRRAGQVRDICRSVPHIIATSGSPIENHAGEYFTILNILKPERFRNYKQYVEDYCDYYETAYGPKVGGIKDIEKFKRDTSDFIIRRRMVDVQQDLPALHRKFINCEFASDKLQREYESLQQEFSKYFYENEGKENFQQGILARIAKMRHVAGISKIPFTVEYVMDIMNDTNEKVILFTEHIDVSDTINFRLIKELQEMRDAGSTIANPIRFTSELNPIQRDDIVKEFISDPNKRILLASTKAAGEGLDGLQKVCQHIIMVERQWNPKKEEQAEKRVQRIGSIGTRDEEGNIGRISADYILVAGSIDEYFTEIVEIKRANVNQTLDGVDYDFNESSLIKELSIILAQKGSKKWKLK